MSQYAGGGTVAALYAAARDPQLWPAALKQLAAAIGGGYAMLAHYDLEREVESVVTGAADPRGAAGAAAEVGRLATALAARLAGLPVGQAGPPDLIELTGRPDADAMPMHLLLPHPALCGEEQVGWIGVALPSPRPLLVDRARRRLEMLRDHLTHAVDIALELARARAASSSIVTLLSALPTAALMLDAGGHVIQANSAARAILAAGDGIAQTRDRRLRATCPGDDGKLAAAIRATLSAGPHGPAGEHRVVQVRGTAGASLLVVLDPIPPQHAWAREGTTLLLRMVDASQSPQCRTYPLQAAFDLTAAEMRVAALIANGLSPALAARRLDVSTNTVRTHLLRVFDKTGVRSQHALTLLLAASGSWSTV